jgi:hypothetical protein
MGLPYLNRNQNFKIVAAVRGEAKTVLSRVFATLAHCYPITYNRTANVENALADSQDFAPSCCSVPGYFLQALSKLPWRQKSPAS